MSGDIVYPFYRQLLRRC